MPREIASPIIINSAGRGQGSGVTDKSDNGQRTTDNGQITEWYENRAEGIEHGFTLNNPPMEREGDEALRVEMEFSGEFSLKANEDGKGLILTNRAGQKLSYDKLKVWDATGRELASEMKVRGRRVSIEVADLDAEYPLTIDPVFSQATKLTASDGAAGDEFGISVAISGDTIVVGAQGDDNAGNLSGSAYVFERNQGGADNWGEVTKLTAADGAASDFFGSSVAISGDTIIIGADGDDDAGNASGSAYVFERNQGGADNRGEVTKLTASDGAAGDQFGNAVAISGDTIIVCVVADDSFTGSAYVFERNQGGADNWGEVTKLTAADGASFDSFGQSVAISGDTIIIGADSSRGSAYLYVNECDQWVEISKSQASDREAEDFFGTSVSISGDTAIVGASFEDRFANNAGAAYIFERNQGGADNWGEVQKIQASDKQADDLFGYLVSISGDTAIVGAPFEDTGGTDAGAAYLFERNQGGADNWGEVQKIQASDKQADDLFGISVAISGDTAIVGAPFEDTGGSDAGAAYLFTINCPPMISTMPVSLQRGTTNSGATIATVSDDLTPASNLSVSVESAPSGINLTNIVNTNGMITADVTADCSAMLGANTVTLSVVDQHGLVTMADLTVNVSAETTPPVITCPANITATATTPGSSTVIVNYSAPSATDNCGAPTVVCTPPSGSAFSLGVTSVTCTATDASGNTASCSFTVTTFDVCVQDDSSASRVLLWNSQTGDYLICFNGTSVSGRGTVTKLGNIFKLTHYATGRRLTAQADKGINRGSASLQMPVGVMVCSITDRDIRNNACSCSP